jgi:hypothetical protein
MMKEQVMKTCIKYLLLILVFANPVCSIAEKAMGDGMMMGMMSHDQMMKMHAHMKEMQKIMKDIKQEKNTESIHVLMEKHMQSMQEGMHMMNKGMKGAKPTKREVGNNMSMDMMARRMNMMQMMMGQMMEHMGMMGTLKNEKEHEHN